MADNRQSTGPLGLILGALVGVAALIFLMTGGKYSGKQPVEGDDDLPPVASGVTGARVAPEAPVVPPKVPVVPNRPIVAPPSSR